MSTVDIFIVVLLLIGAYKGYKDGFLMALFSLLAIILGIIGGFKLMGISLIYLSEYFNIDEKILPYVAFGVVFLIIVIAVTLLGKTIKASIDKSFLGRIDESAGAIVGILKMAFLVSVILWITHALQFSFPDEWTTGSYVMPLVADIAPGVSRWIAQFVPALRDVFE